MILTSLTKPNLVLLAEELGIPVQKSMRKPAIIEAISKCGANDDEVEECWRAVSEKLKEREVELKATALPALPLLLKDVRRLERNKRSRHSWGCRDSVVAVSIYCCGAEISIEARPWALFCGGREEERGRTRSLWQEKQVALRAAAAFGRLAGPIYRRLERIP
ncbi:hypothetical protein MRX96_046746 [Rhipicephalus microplus]